MADEPVEPPVDEEEGGPVKPYLDHPEALRWVPIKCVASLIVGMGVCMAGSPLLVKILSRPLPPGMKITVFGPGEGFMLSMKISFLGGIALSLPLLLYFIGRFVFPALKKNEKKYFLHAIIIGAGLFF